MKAQDFLSTKPRKTRFVMCPPNYLSTRIPNNVFMKSQKIDVERALKQYARIKNVIQAFDVEVLEIPAVKACQDQTYTANIAIAIEPYVILANYKAPGRDCEVPPARKFFEEQGYTCIQPPFFFEGEADLKLIKEGVYVGGFGQFTDIKAHEWIAKTTGVKIIPVEEMSEQLYHLDCSLFVINKETFLVAKNGLNRAGIKELEKLGEVVFAPESLSTTGITNGVKIEGKNIYLSGAFNPELDDYRKACEWLFELFDRFKYTVVLLDTDEADKSGADLSCMIMHLTF